MSRLTAPLKRNINVPDENDVIIKTPYKPTTAARQFGTPLKISNTPHNSLLKPTPKTPGLNLRTNTFLGSSAFTTPIRKPDFEVFEDEKDEDDDMQNEVEKKSPDPHLPPVEEDEDEVDTCVGHPIYHLNEEDFNYFKDIEEVDLYDPSIESYKKYYGHLSEIVLEDFLVHLPETDDEAGNVSDDDFFDFLECA
jgi:hypothetical protein